ncbi:hypothetical protein [Exiguobacterium oxidotolerans]|uniref:Uncharacterized protein n=1 Tax=Exiguobacterium oxidotolerans TaxID=223958 RepID=A0A653IG89_9BACL|nr:hypothetical protein [Exiguobacterium oxidotolerans]VWX38042.1 conserved exported hypothetical protein [Exiguobacterium oxidotolerans]
MGSLIWVGLMVAFGVISVISKAADKSKANQPTRTPSKEFGDYVKNMVGQAETMTKDDAPPAVKKKQQRPLLEDRRTDMQRHTDRQLVSKTSTNIGQIKGSIAEGAIGTKAVKKTGMQTTQEEARRAIIWSEVLGPPVSKRKTKTPHS